MGGAFGINGPPLVVYGALRGWSPQRFPATLQGYFLPASSLTMAGFAVGGLWTHTVTRGYLFSLPLIVLAVLIGRAINQRLKAQAFLTDVYPALMAIAAEAPM